MGLSRRFWLSLVLTGLGTGIGSGLLMRLLRATQHLAWAYHEGNFLQAAQQASAERRVIVVLLAGVLAGGVRWGLRSGGAGSTTELAQALWFHSGRLPPLRALAKAALSITIVGMGASLGREAAAKQSGAALANIVANVGGLTSIERRLLVACAVGAGVAAIYNVPLGGALFALEVLLGRLSLQLIPPALASSMLASGASWCLLPHEPTFSVPSYPLVPSQLLWAALAGPLAGLASVIYVRAIAWVDGHKAEGRKLLLVPPLVFLVLGLLAIAYPALLGNGKDIVQLAFAGTLGIGLLLPLLLLKPLMTCACLGSGAPGGLFMPTIACGALLGAALGAGWNLIWPEPLGSYAIIGAAAVLAAATQGPVSALVMMMELAPGHQTLTLAAMLAVALAVWVGRRLEVRSIYSGRIHSGRKASDLQVRMHDAPPVHLRTPAGRDVVTSHQYARVSAAADYGEMLRRRLQAGAQPVYVVDEQGGFLGVLPPAQTLTEALSPAARLLATAADLVRPLKPLKATADRVEGFDRLATNQSELPIVDAEGRLIGVARLPPALPAGASVT